MYRSIKVLIETFHDYDAFKLKSAMAASVGLPTIKKSTNLRLSAASKKL
jgi:hypothetical protein